MKTVPTLMTPRHPVARAAAMAVTALALGACSSGSDDEQIVLNTLPAGLATHSVTDYPATAVAAGVPGATAATQDLLTGGLGRTGLGAGAAPVYADPANPTAAELRRNAIHSNYRAILDPSANGGYGRLYGPNLDSAGNDTRGEGLIPGREYIATLDDGSGRKRVVVAVQVPSNFDPAAPCIVAGPSSGSRGVYGAVGSAGEWGLKRRCAVVLNDNGKGMGLHDPGDDSVHRVDGTRAARTAAGALSHFAAQLGDAARAAFVAAFPNRLALKHVHSQLNPEKDWGTDTLASIRYALYVLNELYGDPFPGVGGRQVRFTPANTLVIAGSVSNGGGAVLRAAEQDAEGLIDGVVATEPSAQPAVAGSFAVQFAGAVVPNAGKPLIDYFTLANLYQPCAALAPAATMAEVSFHNYMTLAGLNARAANRCTALAARGLVNGASTAEQAADALSRLRSYGYAAEHDTMHNAHYGLGNSPIIAMMYTNAFGRFALDANLCGMSLAQVNAAGDPIPPVALVKAGSFASGNGTANGAPASVVYNDSVGGAKSWAFAVSPTSGTADFALDAALCQRALVTGVDPVSGAALTASSTPTLAQSQAVRQGMGEALLSGNLRGKPTLVVAGRSDALVPVNHSARAYAAFNRGVEGTSKLSYVEVVNAQHFDTFLTLSGFDSRYVPLHPYFNRAMDAMWAHLTGASALPPSQVVRTTPRGGTPGAAPALTAAQVPAWSQAPAAADAISFNGSTIRVPQ